ncbi:MAG TPA: hypothetical protein VMW24_18790 [Sedimentisphaerales bacterium]|nr:hypothetical protein [Sedimentisphaerales bacterium]
MKEAENAGGLERLKWQRAEADNDFDLALYDAAISDAKQQRLLALLTDVIDSDGHGIGFNKKAAAQLEEFFNNPHDTLPATAYALLSNWFAGGAAFSKTPRARAAEKLWQEMGFVHLQNRLTDPHADSKILPYRFNPWWTRQMAVQDQEM